jgi:hypothetical protein
MAHPLPRKTSARFSRRLQPQQQPQQPPPRKQGAMTDDHTLMQLLSLRNMLCRVQNEQYHNPPSCTGARPALGRGGKAWGQPVFASSAPLPARPVHLHPHLEVPTSVTITPPRPPGRPERTKPLNSAADSTTVTSLVCTRPLEDEKNDMPPHPSEKSESDRVIPPQPLPLLPRPNVQQQQQQQSPR